MPTEIPTDGTIPPGPPPFTHSQSGAETARPLRSHEFLVLFLFLVAPALVVVGIVIGPGGVLPVVLYALAAVMVGTSLVGSCPLYTLLGVKTCPVNQTGAPAAAGGATDGVGAGR